MKRNLIISLLLLLPLSIPAQGFQLKDTIRIIGRFQSQYISRRQEALYVMQSFVLTRYNLNNKHKPQLVDIVRGGGDVLYGSHYITQSHDSLYIKEIETEKTEWLRFDRLFARNMACTPGAETVVLAGLDIGEGIYYFQANRELKRLKTADSLSGIIRKIELSPNGNFLSVQLLTKEMETDFARIYDLSTGKLAGEIEMALNYRLRFSPDSRQIVTIDNWGDMHVFDLFPQVMENGVFMSESVSGRPDMHSIDAFDFIDSSGFIASCSENGLFSVWDTRNGDKYCGQPMDFSPGIRDITYAGQYAAVSFKDSAIAIYFLPEKPVRPVQKEEIGPVLQKNHFGWIKDIFVDTARNYIYTRCSKGELKIWDKSSLLQVSSIPGIDEDAEKISFDSPFLIAAHHIIDTRLLREITPYSFSKNLIFSIRDYDPADNRFFVVIRDSLKKMDPLTGRVSSIPVKHRGKISNLCLNPAGNQLAIADRSNQSISVYSTVDGSLLHTINWNSVLYQLFYHPYQNWLLGYDREQFNIWNPLTGDILLSIKETGDYNLTENIYSCCFSYDYRYLVIGYGSGKIVFWNLDSRKKEKEFRMKKLVSAMAFIDPHTALVACYEELYLYDFSRSRVIYTLHNRIKLEPINKILLNEKQDRLYTLTGSRVSSWKLNTLLQFFVPDLSPSLPRYLADISYTRDSAGIVGTDLFTYPSLYWFGKDSVITGTKHETEAGRNLDGILSVASPLGGIVTAIRQPSTDKAGFMIFDLRGMLIADLLKTFDRATPYLLRVCLEPNGSRLFFTGENKSGTTIYSLHLRDFQVKEVLRLKDVSPRYLKFINDSVLLAAGSNITLINVYNGRLYSRIDIASVNTGWYDPGSDILYTASDSRIRLYKTKPFLHEIKTIAAPGIEYLVYSALRKELITGTTWGEMNIYDGGDLRKKLSILPLDTMGFAVFLPGGYYYASKSIAPGLLAFRRGNRTYPFEQFDQELNRPDLVVSQFLHADTTEIKALTLAFNKRRKQQPEYGYTDIDQSIEKLEITDRYSLPSVVQDSLLRIRMQTESHSFKNKKLIVTDNGVPVYSGPPGKDNLLQEEVVVELELTEGVNNLQLFTIDSNNHRSTIEKIKLLYQPAVKPASRVFFVGIGIDHFASPGYDLQYSVKDIRDLAGAFSEHGAVILDTLFDKRVTRENIRTLKTRLLNLSVHDKIVIAYSGHGLLSSDFDYYLSTYAVNFKNPEKDGLPYHDLEYLMEGIGPRKKLLLIDACHSGEVDKEELEKMKQVQEKLDKNARGVIVTVDPSSIRVGMKSSFELMQELFVNVGKTTGTAIISAAAGTQFALENNNLQNGVFTYSVIDAFRKHASLSIGELKKIVTENVIRLTNGMQKPTFRNEIQDYDWQLW